MVSEGGTLLPGGGGQLVAKYYTVWMYIYICVCVWWVGGWGGGRGKVCVCFAQNKQNLYSLNRMTLYKFSCAAMGLQVYVYVFVWVLVCVWVCVGGWADNTHKNFSIYV